MIRISSPLSLCFVLVACSQATPSNEQGLSGAVQVTQLAAGDPNCPQGGARIDTPDESAYVCNGAGGADAILGKAFLPFSDGTLLPMNGDWVELAGSAFTPTTHGGTLEVFMDITVGIGSTSAQFACRPMVDGTWLGEIAGIPEDGRRGEGVAGLLPGVPYLWSKTRLYRGLAAGKHRFSIECFGAPNNEDEVSACGYTESTCAWGFVELAP